MTNSEKLKLAREHFKALGISPLTGAPPILRALWLLGIPAPPMVFWRFSTITLFTGIFFGICFGVAMWTIFGAQGTPWWIISGVSALAGAAFGLSNAQRSRALARKFGLPLWAEYSGPPAVPPKPIDADDAPPDFGKPDAISRFSKLVRCPQCGHGMRLGLAWFIPRLFDPRATCPACHERCALRLSIRIAGSVCGFVAGMIVIALMITAMVVSGYINTTVAFASVLISVFIWTVVKMFISYRYCELAKSVLP